MGCYTNTFENFIKTKCFIFGGIGSSVNSKVMNILHLSLSLFIYVLDRVPCPSIPFTSQDIFNILNAALIGGIGSSVKSEVIIILQTPSFSICTHVCVRVLLIKVPLKHLHLKTIFTSSILHYLEVLVLV